jgi:hypothetical protein
MIIYIIYIILILFSVILYNADKIAIKTKDDEKTVLQSED